MKRAGFLALSTQITNLTRGGNTNVLPLSATIPALRVRELVKVWELGLEGSMILSEEWMLEGGGE